ncbi:internal scaffolding protein [Microviridae sp.]|nr:internal scaffolding protein [Microviridae sp.]
MEFRTAYGKHDRLQFTPTGVSRTHQSMAPECDINNIMRRFEKTGVLDHLNRYEGSYGDFTAVPSDYHEAINSVMATNEMFLTLPAKIRKRFGNDPGHFLDFVQDPSNQDEMIKLGIAFPKDRPDQVIEETPGKKPAKVAKPDPAEQPKGEKNAEKNNG